MNKFNVFGDNSQMIKEEFVALGYEYDEGSPDFVISYGGDGTLLRSETAYPEVPKLFLKNTNIGKLAQNKKNQEVVEAFVKGRYFIKEYDKLTAIINQSEALVGASEITIHNKDPRSGIRYKVRIDSEDLHHELIGDGLIVCNPLGSTGYYRSITDSYFEIGIGVAFNNSTEQADHVVLSDKRKIEIEITRGPAIVFADNQDKMLELGVSDKILISKSDKKFKLIRVNDDTNI